MIRNKRGSSSIMLAIIITAFMGCIAGAITISRGIVVKSECEGLTRLWGKAILSEYDVFLLDEYGIQAFYGNEKDISNELDYFMDYSCKGKLDARIGKSAATVSTYCLKDAPNFRKAIKNSVNDAVIDELISGGNRIKRETSEEAFNERVIANHVVIDTLPSGTIDSSLNIDAVSEKLKDEGVLDVIKSSAGNTATDLLFIRSKLGNNLYAANENETFFRNEWEYIISGSKDDKENYRNCRTKLFLIRNALNLASIYKDAEKTAAISEISLIITPGPGAVLTQAIIAEAWAAAETEADLKALYEYKRVPLLKGPGDWKISLESILKSDSLNEKLDEETKKLLKENEEEIGKKTESIDSVKDEVLEGQNYEDYLLLIMSFMNENVRETRIMDIIQINMKYRHYADFNMDEYYVGVSLSIEANGRTYESESVYK